MIEAKILNAELVKVARDWCLECWPQNEDEILEASPGQIERAVARSWDGGLQDFIQANGTDAGMRDRIFSAKYPCGIVWADRAQLVGGDYKRLAFLPYDTVELEIERDCPPEVAAWIRGQASWFVARKGQKMEVSTCGHTVTLGGAA